MKLHIYRILIVLAGVIAFSPHIQAQTKIMEFNTGLAWSDSGIFLTDRLTPIGTDFLAVIINSNPADIDPGGDQIVYILDLKKRALARKIEVAGQSGYWVSPSATTSSFILWYWTADSDRRVSLYNFNKKTRNWSVAIDDAFGAGKSTSDSTPVLPSYFVNTVRGGDNLELHVFKY